MSIFAVDKDGNRKQIAGVGLPGPAGKSAYQYAVEGGFAGTEAEFRSLIGMHSNPNLLDNWYFPSPINQRGQTEYTGEGYTICRWKLAQNDTNFLKIENGFIHVHIGSFGAFGQLVTGLDINSKYTFSFLTNENELAYFTMPNLITTGSSFPIKIGNRTIRLYVYNTKAENVTAFLLHVPAGDDAIDINFVAAKLELGSVQTLAHQDASGNWILNDPPPNPALELAKCQRYQMVYNCPESGYGHIAYVMKSQEGIWYGFLHLPNSLRSRPSIRVTGGEPILNIFNAIHNVSDWGVLSLTGNHALIYVSSPTDVPKGTWAMLQTTNSPAQLILDSNL